MNKLVLCLPAAFHKAIKAREAIAAMYRENIHRLADNIDRSAHAEHVMSDHLSWRTLHVQSTLVDWVAWSNAASKRSSMPPFVFLLARVLLMA